MSILNPKYISLEPSHISDDFCLQKNRKSVFPYHIKRDDLNQSKSFGSLNVSVFCNDQLWIPKYELNDVSNCGIGVVLFIESKIIKLKSPPQLSFQYGI